MLAGSLVLAALWCLDGSERAFADTLSGGVSTGDVTDDCFAACNVERQFDRLSADTRASAAGCLTLLAQAKEIEARAMALYARARTPGLPNEEVTSLIQQANAVIAPRSRLLVEFQRCVAEAARGKPPLQGTVTESQDAPPAPTPAAPRAYEPVTPVLGSGAGQEAPPVVTKPQPAAPVRKPFQLGSKKQERQPPPSGAEYPEPQEVPSPRPAPSPPVAVDRWVTTTYQGYPIYINLKGAQIGETQDVVLPKLSSGSTSPWATARGSYDGSGFIVKGLRGRNGVWRLVSPPLYVTQVIGRPR